MRARKYAFAASMVLLLATSIVAQKKLTAGEAKEHFGETATAHLLAYGLLTSTGRNSFQRFRLVSWEAFPFPSFMSSRSQWRGFLRHHGATGSDENGSGFSCTRSKLELA